MNRLIFLICVFALSAFGCIYIPPTLTVDKWLEKFDSSPSDYLCDYEIKIPPQISMPAKNNEFDASGFSLVNWNIQKGTQAGWESDFERLSQNSDILIIQEALLTEELRRILNRKPYYWHLVTAFEIQQTKAGVLTAANIEPDFVCPLRAVEPLIRVPKTALITRYRLSNTHRSLMIANIHMINFALNLAAFYDQMHQMTEILVAHQGPMIVSGDFNTWSEERLAIIDDMAARLELKSVKFEADFSRKVFGYTVDRIYYRGLTPEEALVLEVTSSDHNPLLVRFRINM